MPCLHSSEGAVRIRLLGASRNSIGGLTFRQPDFPEFSRRFSGFPSGDDSSVGRVKVIHSLRVSQPDEENSHDSMTIQSTRLWPLLLRVDHVVSGFAPTHQEVSTMQTTKRRDVGVEGNHLAVHADALLFHVAARLALRSTHTDVDEE